MNFFIEWIISVFKAEWPKIGAIVAVITGILHILNFFEKKQDKKRKNRGKIDGILIDLKKEVENGGYYATDDKIKKIIGQYCDNLLKIKKIIGEKDLKKLEEIRTQAINFQIAIFGINLDKIRSKDPFRGPDSEDRIKENLLEKERQTTYFALINSIESFLKN